VRLEWLKADASLREAAALDENDAFTRSQHAIQIALAVGHSRRAVADMRAAHQLAPANALVALRLAVVLLMSGSSRDASTYMDLGVDLGFPKNLHPMTIMYGFLAMGERRYREAADVLSEDMMVRAVGAQEAIRLAMNALERGTGRAEAIAALEAVESQADPRALGWVTFGFLAAIYTRLGALDHAYAAANRLLDEMARSGPIWMNPGDLWMPEMRPFRKDARFQQLVGRFGFIPYWKQHGPPDGCELRGDTLVVP
jgi:hypothetical protein